MKSPVIIALIIFVFFNNSFAQSCDCAKEFIYIKDKIEKNYAGFKDKVNDKTVSLYGQRTQSALKLAKSTTSPAHCVYLINDWLTFFRDQHNTVGRERLSVEKEKVDLQKRIDGIDRLNLSEKELQALSSSQGVTGIYWDEDSTSQIAVVKSKTTFRDYAGVVISSKTGKWLPGQVVLELKKGKDTLKGILYDKYYIPNNASLQIKRDALGSFTRDGSKQPFKELTSGALVDSRVLSAKTLYMSISTFRTTNAKNIDSLFKANQANLSKMPYLILDLRNNPGGADFSYKPITKYLYTHATTDIGADVLSTDDNAKAWAALMNTEGIPPDQTRFINSVVEKMEQHKGELVSFSEDKKVTLDSVSAYPKKIIILINKICGSTTEEFLLMARQSKKVTLMGEHTAGVLDYSNMRATNFSCMPYTLYWATSRSRRIDLGMAIDNVGIQPNIELKQDQNWVEVAKQFIEK